MVQDRDKLCAAQPPSKPIREGIEKGGTNPRPNTPRPSTPPGATGRKGPGSGGPAGKSGSGR